MSREAGEREGPGQMSLESHSMSFYLYLKMTRNGDDMTKPILQKIRHLVKRRLWLDQLGDLYLDREETSCQDNPHVQLKICISVSCCGLLAFR